MADSKQRILIQLDSSPHASVFDAVTAIDAGADRLLQYGGIEPDQVRELIHGAMFTRGLDELKNTAVFVGGPSVEASERILEAVKHSFFGPFRVSVLFDANGANTTASAAVLAAERECGGSLKDVPVAVMGATGPVGHRVARLLCGLGARVAVGSRSRDRAAALAESLDQTLGARAEPFAADDLAQVLAGRAVVIAAGAAGVRLMPRDLWRGLESLKVIIDLNAVPPLGVEGVEATDKSTSKGNVKAWGALGVGGLKMKIHKRSIQELFTSNDKVLDVEQVLEIGRRLEPPPLIPRS